MRKVPPSSHVSPPCLSFGAHLPAAIHHSLPIQPVQHFVPHGTYTTWGNHWCQHSLLCPVLSLCQLLSATAGFACKHLRGKGLQSLKGDGKGTAKGTAASVDTNGFTRVVHVPCGTKCWTGYMGKEWWITAGKCAPKDWQEGEHEKKVE